LYDPARTFAVESLRTARLKVARLRMK